MLRACKELGTHSSAAVGRAACHAALSVSLRTPQGRREGGEEHGGGAEAHGEAARVLLQCAREVYALVSTRSKETPGAQSMQVLSVLLGFRPCSPCRCYLCWLRCLCCICCFCCGPGFPHSRRQVVRKLLTHTMHGLSTAWAEMLYRCRKRAFTLLSIGCSCS